MSLMNFLPTLHSTLLVLALIITLHPELLFVSAQATTQTCDRFFNPRINTDPRASAADSTSCADKANKKYACSLSTCTIKNIPWDKFTFKKCSPYKSSPPNSPDLDPTKPVRETLTALFYRANNVKGYVDVQSREDKLTYRCPFSTPSDDNAQRATCSGCS
ncbi:hypothetical protein PTTG_12335 [Puccinia triticina 1-1 BBBD Race 1]|uniref:Secreted protein n=2 Tax=Puccinia triticina TaxID=208348 RepID=A0A180GYF6_PUCT1|nr:uncharacterized protein PtA15_17A160 [Puccinia triticina]OAV97292.1 hypothetical protein PTTG_12335 [Puccinia triticina 1-1 BBBD Race 1]WAQ92678.1 hypothetical protein PtA15_17A160 [Puccinia triticina]WAR63571.1 hypothetical protein PtB15_17B171 [Puccinia triticina]